MNWGLRPQTWHTTRNYVHCFFRSLEIDPFLAAVFSISASNIMIVLNRQLTADQILVWLVLHIWVFNNPEIITSICPTKKQDLRGRLKPIFQHPKIQLYTYVHNSWLCWCKFLQLATNRSPAGRMNCNKEVRRGCFSDYKRFWLIEFACLLFDQYLLKTSTAWLYS